MKKLLTLLLALCLLCGCALAEPGPLQWTEDMLTEIYGYSYEEAQAFQYEDDGEGTVTCWPETHPGWKYTLRYDQNGWTDMITPFQTGVGYYPGEGTVRAALNGIRQAGWLNRWSPESKAALQAHCQEQGIRPQMSLLSVLSDENSTPAQAVCAFFESCYGPNALWPAALTEWRDSVLAEYGLALPEAQAPSAGIRRVDIPGSDAHAVTFYREAPQELKQAFSHPMLDGWELLCGCLKAYDTLPDTRGLAAFEKPGKRLLVLLCHRSGEWEVMPLGENALYAQGELTITCDTGVRFYLNYTLNDHETAQFAVVPSTYLMNGDRTFTPSLYCRIEEYIRVDSAARQVTRILPDGWRIYVGQLGDTPEQWTADAQYPAYLGAVDINDFPTTLEEAQSVRLLPLALESGSLAMAGDVHLRSQTSSRSKDLGMIKAGALLPVLDTLPGEPWAWIHTQLGPLSGYVASVYTQGDPSTSPPLPVAKTKKEVPLKKGTGLLDGTVQTLPAGTRMHVVLEDDSWYYVAIPQGELRWFMDMNSTFGYVKKADVAVVGMACQLGWIN